MLILDSHWTRRPHHRHHGKCHIKVTGTKESSEVLSPLCLKVLGFLSTMLMSVKYFVCQIFFLFCLYCNLAGNCWSCRIFYTAVMRFNCAELPQTPDLWPVIKKSERWKETQLFSIFSRLCIPALCYLVPGGWYMHIYIHTQRDISIDTKTPRITPY